ncbi:MAG: cbb3-type cytochrome c oxidase subunit I [Anaerolineae bacterium]
MLASEKRLVGWHMVVAILALFVGSLFGPMQGLEHAGVDLYTPLMDAGLLQSYYQGLSLHGVLNALVWTTVFITGFLTLVIVNSLKTPIRWPWMSWLAFATMVIGLLIAAVPLLLNQASVLYTFYPPMQAPWYYYIGLVIFVVGSWITGWSMYGTYFKWRAANKGQTTPFLALASIITLVLWQICTLGVAVEILVLIVPWTLNILPGIDSQIARTFFWFTGHPLVYFWLLPAYVSWYGMMPKQVGGKLFSMPLAYLAFWLFLVFSTPVGFHHQYVDPGVPDFWKWVHALLTYGVFFPSLLTAFNVIASLELGGRARGGKGVLGWIPKLPWGDPSVAAQLLAMIVFAFGGIGGLINASYNVNLVVHNTTWVPGHFHTTVGTGVTLTFMGILYWMLPYLTGRKLWGRRWALTQAWVWTIGVAIFSTAMHRLGLLGAPRRTMLGAAMEAYGSNDTRIWTLLTATGGVIMFVSLLIFVVVVVMTAFFSKERVQVEMPVAEAYEQPLAIPAWLSNWGPWLGATVVLILLSYGPILVQMLSNAQWVSPGFKVW